MTSGQARTTLDNMKYSETDERMSVREPRAIYVPIFDSFFESSIMREDVVTRFVFLALIRLAHRPRSNGMIDVDPFVFASSINIPFDEVEKSIKRLMEPDPLSGSKASEGRRLVPLDPDRPMRGWQVVNWLGYKKLLHRANDKVRKANQRSVDKTGQLGQDGYVTHDTIRNDTKRKEEKRERVVFVPPTLEEMAGYISEKGYPLDAEAIYAHYVANGWVQSSGRPIKDWKAAVVTCAKRPRFDTPAATQNPAGAKPPRLTPEQIADGEAAASRQREAMQEIAAIEKARAARGLK